MANNLTMYTESARPYSGFLHVYDNEKTRKNYADALRKFLRFIPQTEPDPLTDEICDAIAVRYFADLKNGRNCVHDLMQFSGSLTKTLAPATVRLTLQILCIWFEDNNFCLTRQAKKRIFGIVPRRYSIRHEAELTRTLFRNIYCQMTKEWTRTLLLVLLSTGMRLGEALALQETDIIRTGTRTGIHIRAETTKTKTERTVHLTEEAATALDAYLKDAGTQLRKKPAYIFPCTKAAAERQMRRAADKAGYDKNQNNLRPVHWHMTRKWFITRMAYYGNREVAEEFAGHNGYLSRAYRRLTARQTLAAFRKAEPYLTLFPDPDNSHAHLKTDNRRKNASAASATLM